MACSACLVDASYAGVKTYMNHVLTINGLKGFVVDVLTQKWITHIRRACDRNVGAPNRVRPLTQTMLREMSSVARSTEEETTVDMAVVATAFLLRLDEVASRERRDVVVSDDGHTVSISIPVSKTDQRGLGVTRTIRCGCVGSKVEPTCAACALKRMLDRPPSWAVCSKSTKLCKDRSGRSVTYDRFCHLLWQMLEALGYQTRDADTRRHIFGGHSCRRGGAQALARAGFSLRFISLWGRWESDCVRLYVEQAELEGAEPLVSAVLTQSSSDLAKQWAKARGPRD